MREDLKNRYTALLIEIVPSTENDVDLDIEATVMGWMLDYLEISKAIEDLITLIDNCGVDLVKRILEYQTDEIDSD
jgi:hypothetical protein